MKKTLSVLLTIAMLLSLSVCAFAEGEPETQASEPVAKIVVTPAGSETAVDASSMQAAVDQIDASASTVAGGEVDVVESGTTGATVVDVKDGSDVVIDLNGNDLTVTDPAVGSKGTETLGFQLLDKTSGAEGSVTITSTGETGEIIFENNHSNQGGDLKVGIQNYTDLTLDNVVIDGTGLDDSITNYVVSNNSGSLTITNGAGIIAEAGDVAFDVFVYQSGGYAEPPVVTIETDAGTIRGTIEFDGAGNMSALESAETPSLSIEGGNFVNFLLQIGDAVANFAKDHIKISGGTFDSKDVKTAGDTADNAKYAFEDFLVESYVVVEQGGKYVVMTQADADALNKEVVAVIPFTPAEYNYYTGGTTGTVATAGNAEVVVDGETVSVALNDTVVSAKVAPVALADNAPAEVKVVVSHTALSGNVFTAIDMVQNIADTLIVKDVEGVHLDAEHYEVVFDGYDTITLKLAPELLAELGAGSHVFTIVLGGGYEIQVTVVVA
ncbi:MAG: hypothetical protein IJZ91_00155 [Oscillospiraceae bacterium]|nr:hypothetical protein [Oscillospiraceae bacterium]